MAVLVSGPTIRRCYRGTFQVVFITIVLVTLIIGVTYYTKGKSSLSSNRKVITVYRQSHIHQVEAAVKDADEYRIRLQRYQDVCAVRKDTVRSYKKVFYYPNDVKNRSLSLCSVPKAGCTFWAKVFQYLNRTSKSRKVSSPLDITRFEVYYYPLVKMHEMLYNLDRMSNALRFFFVRDPYARLMSAYVDKFLLPQFLSWPSYGHIVASYRGDLNTETEEPCLVELMTFREFIETIVFSEDRNAHWRPMYTVCDPCKMFPHFIGKQETFNRDVKHVLRLAGLDHLMTSYSHGTYIGDEMRQMIHFTYAFRDIDAYLRKCFDDLTIAERIWQAFVMNGYLVPNTPFPRSEMITVLLNATNTKAVINIVTELVVREHARAGITRAQHSKQKREMLVKEFRTLPAGTMEKLADLYDVDFRMFGYEKYPKELFPWRYK